MKILVLLSLNLVLFFNAFANNSKYKVGLLVMATGRYINFVPPLIDSAEKYFCKNHNVTYFVFTDNPDFKYLSTVNIFQNKLGWPNDTMLRYQAYYNNKDKFKEMDYLFATDADMLFVDTVGDEILSDRVATMHPGFLSWKKHKQDLPYETNKISTAYIDPKDGEYYFAGGFYGGTRTEMVKLLETNVKNVYNDFKNNHVAVWHDESHNNRYFIDNKPTKVLTSSYCYPEDAQKPELQSSYQEILHLPKKLIALSRKPAGIKLEDNTKTVEILDKYKNEVGLKYNSYKTCLNSFYKNKGKVIAFFDKELLNKNTVLFKNIATEALIDIDPKFLNLNYEIKDKFSSQIDLVYLNSSLVDDLENARSVINNNLLSAIGLVLINNNKSEYAIAFLLNNGLEIIQNEEQVILRKRS